MIISLSRKHLFSLFFGLQVFACTFFAPSILGAEKTVQQEPIRAAYLDPEQKKQMALAATLKEHEKVWLDVLYPEVEAPKQVLAIAKASLIADQQGAILLLHDKEQHADWPQIIRPLRTRLPKYGWFTLAVNLPLERQDQFPERVLEPKSFDQINLTAELQQNLDSGSRKRVETASKVEDETENADPAADPESDEKAGAEAEEGVDINLAAASKNEHAKIPYDVRALSHLEKAMEHLKNQSFQNIVLLADGHSSELALQYIKVHQAELTSPGFALILMEPLLPGSYLLDVTEWLGASFKSPILDITKRPEVGSEDKAELRKLAFERARVVNYRQIVLSLGNSELFHETLTQRIRFWLENAAPGMSVTQ